MTDYPISGHVASGFEAVRDVFEANFAADTELGAGFAVLVDGDILVDVHGGWADRQKTKLWDARSLVPVYSTTKGIAALVLGGLVDAYAPQGYETRVADIWPEFAAHGKEAVTVGQVASHQAGLPGFANEIDPELWLDPPACAAALAAEAPMWTPGDAHGYHPLSWGYLVGEIARRLDPAGHTLGQSLARKMTNTDGSWPDATDAAVDFWIGLPLAEHDRCADIQRPKALADLGEITPARRAAFVSKWSAPNRGGAIWREIEIPSANGHGTALSVAQLYGAYANQGAIGANHVTMTDEMTRARYPASPDLVLPMETSFGAGVMRNTHGFFGPNPDAVGHCGWGGSLALADPARGLSLAYVMNRQSNILVGDPRAVALVNAVYGCL